MKKENRATWNQMIIRVTRLPGNLCSFLESYWQDWWINSCTASSGNEMRLNGAADDGVQPWAWAVSPSLRLKRQVDAYQNREQNGNLSNLHILNYYITFELWLRMDTTSFQGEMDLWMGCFSPARLLWHTVMEGSIIQTKVNSAPCWKSPEFPVR